MKVVESALGLLRPYILPLSRVELILMGLFLLMLSVMMLEVSVNQPHTTTNASVRTSTS
jgi:hypothetical protein